MSKQALYTKYRSRNLGEIVGQQHIVEVLSNAVVKNKISHAYLFTGPHGIGKTSIARIFAHQINEIDYEEGVLNMDIMEIDAASNSGVDDMRELREKIMIAPTKLKYRVYIIDEVHMLSGASFAALLKTIEEPPSHAVFILATTDAHKVPATIMSRVQKFFFRPIDQQQIVKHLTEICKKEDIKCEPEGLELIATEAEGSMRDALSLLDQIASGGKELTKEVVRGSIGLGEEESMGKLEASLKSGDTVGLVKELNKLFEDGADASSIGLQVYNWLKFDLASLEELEVLSELLTLGSSVKPKIGLEFVLIKLCSLMGGSDKASQGKKNSENSKEQVVPLKIERTEQEVLVQEHGKSEKVKKTKKSIAPTKQPEPTKKVEAKDNGVEEIEAEGGLGKQKLERAGFNSEWQIILKELAKTNPSLRAILSGCVCKLDEKSYSLKIATPFKSHLNILVGAKFTQAYAQVLNKLDLLAPKLICSHDATVQKKARSGARADNNAVKEMSVSSSKNDDTQEGGTSGEGDMSDIMELMGGGEAVAL